MSDFLREIDTGRWLEPHPEQMHGKMPYSDELVRVVGVTCKNGANTRVLCVTHHRERFECQWSWLACYWCYAEEATILTAPFDGGEQS